MNAIELASQITGRYLIAEEALEEVRKWVGSSYDFQIEVPSRFILAEVKGLQTRQGAVRHLSPIPASCGRAVHAGWWR